MSDDSSEEKSEAASTKKLRDARKKGQIEKGPDMMVAITSGALIAYVIVAAPGIARRGLALIDLAAHSTTDDFTVALADMLAAAERVLVACAIVPLFIAAAAAVGGGVLANKGFVFTLEPLAPKPEKLNPVEGLKKLFKAQNVIELAKSVVKAVLLGAALSLVARAGIGALVQAPVCSPGCLPSILRSMLSPLLGAAALLYVLSAIADMPLQRWVFLRDMRMTKTEVKRERKDTQGNPMVKARQRGLRREGSDASRTGFAQVTLLVCREGRAIGLRYVKGETPLPVVVFSGSGERADRAADEARGLGIPVIRDGELTDQLARGVGIGQAITRKFFPRVVQALLSSSKEAPTRA